MITIGRWRLRLAGPHPIFACDRAAVAAELAHAKAVIEEVRNVLQASAYFTGTPVVDVVDATDLLATAYEAERSRP